ncbi:hypothetical protein F5146DRAFT_281811 [Armillaria mellea]|nr:hypothetical protein F5146DRAFT_281811 [Armillaria mellea]
MVTSLDPYTTKAENNDLTPQQKIEGLHEIVQSVKTGMLTTRSADGHLHSRAMMPSAPFSGVQLVLAFVANNASHKFEEIDNDSHVNVSFFNTDTTSWASYSGRARVTRDKETIAKHWSTSLSAYFGDLEDGVHKGDVNDPRISIIEVVPEEIRYWVATKGSVGRAIEAAVSSVTKTCAAPGELRTISKAEIQLTQRLQSTS